METTGTGEIEAEIGRWVKEMRNRAGRSQEDVSQKCGLARRTLFALENGEGSTLGTLLAVLSELGEAEAALQRLLGGEAPPRTHPTPARQRSAPATRIPKKKVEADSAAENPWIFSR